jgi:hypothetical protein
LKSGGKIKMKKTILIFVLAVTFAMLFPSVSAETQTHHFNGKWAFAMGWSEGVFFKILANADHAFIAAYDDDWQFFCIPLEKGDFKWSMDHATLTFTLVIEDQEITRTVVWDTCGPTKTKHYNEKFDCYCMEFHIVTNCKYRPACVSVYDECGDKIGCGCGHVNHGVGSVIVKNLE